MQRWVIQVTCTVVEKFYKQGKFIESENVCESTCLTSKLYSQKIKANFHWIIEKLCLPLNLIHYNKTCLLYRF